MVLVFSFSNFFINKNSQGRKLSGKKYLLAVIHLSTTFFHSFQGRTKGGKLTNQCIILAIFQHFFLKKCVENGHIKLETTRKIKKKNLTSYQAFIWWQGRENFLEIFCSGFVGRVDGIIPWSFFGASNSGFPAAKN